MFFKKKVSAHEFGAWLCYHYGECAELTTQKLMARYVQGAESLPRISEGHKGFPRESCYNFLLGLAAGCGITTFECLNEPKIGVVKMEFLSQLDLYNDKLKASFDPLERSFDLQKIVERNEQFQKTGDIVSGAGKDPSGLSYQIIEYCMKTFMRGTPLFRDALDNSEWISQTFSLEFRASFNAGAEAYRKLRLR